MNALNVSILPNQTIYVQMNFTFVGSIFFTYILCNNLGGCVSNCGVNVFSVRSPVCVPDFVTTPKNTNITVDVLDNNISPDVPFNESSVVITGGPSIGNAVVLTNGSIYYEPVTNNCNSTSLNYSCCDILNECCSTSLNVSIDCSTTTTTTASTSTSSTTAITTLTTSSSSSSSSSSSTSQSSSSTSSFTSTSHSTSHTETSTSPQESSNETELASILVSVAVIGSCIFGLSVFTMLLCYGGWSRNINMTGLLAVDYEMEDYAEIENKKVRKRKQKG
jgi:hypothetical protein